MDISLQILFRHYLEGTLSQEEAAELKHWLEEAETHQYILEELKDPAQIAETFAAMDIVDADAAWEKLKTSRMNNSNRVARVHRVHFLRTAWFRVAVAILIILTGFFVYNKFVQISGSGREMVTAPTPAPDILPGGNKAVLTLSDGRKIELNIDAEGVINDGGLLIKNDNGQLNYGQGEGATHPAAGAGRDYAQDTRTRQHPSEGGDWRASYNTMSTPRGGQYRLVLPDGSKVWLNAESSITFPTVFGGNTREVKITGEAYFEIKADKTKPFIVKTASDEIQVLGTSFNVNAYSDAPVKTSLLQGSVKVKTAILKPGQAFINGKIIATNLEQDIAWKNGVFNFDNMNIDAVFRQLSRWYNVDIKYEGKVPVVEPSGEMGRDLTLSQVLRALKNIGIGTRIEGNTVIVLP